jgi:hypothetical protein
MTALAVGGIVVLYAVMTVANSGVEDLRVDGTALDRDIQGRNDLATQLRA